MDFCCVFTPHFSLLISHAFLTLRAAAVIETLLAYPLAAFGAIVEMPVGFKVCLFKRRSVFLRPY